MNAPPAGLRDAPLVNATRFRQAHEEDWSRLEQIVTRMEKRSIRSLTDDDLLSLPGLYRTTLSSLSVARDTSLDRGLISYLERLSTRAYFQIYGVQTPASRQLAGFFARGWPKAVRALWRETLFCVVLTFGAALVAYLLIRSDPTWFYSMIPEGLADGRDPSASAEFLRSTLYSGAKDKDGWLGAFATFLFTHNSQIAIFAFALGFAFAVPTVLLILYNGLMLGAFYRGLRGEGARTECDRLAHDPRDHRDFRDLHLRRRRDPDRHSDRFPGTRVAHGSGGRGGARRRDGDGRDGDHARRRRPARRRRAADDQR